MFDVPKFLLLFGLLFGLFLLRFAQYIFLLADTMVAKLRPVSKSFRQNRHTLQASCSVTAGLLVTAHLGSAAGLRGRRFPVAS